MIFGAIFLPLVVVFVVIWLAVDSFSATVCEGRVWLFLRALDGVILLAELILIVRVDFASLVLPSPISILSVAF